MYKIDNKTLQSLKEGKKEAFEVVFKRYYHSLHAYALSFVRNEDVAEDIVQDVYTNLWERRSEIEMLDFVNIYLFRSVRNKSLNYIEHQKVKEKHIRHTSKNQYSEDMYFLHSLGGESGTIFNNELSGKIEMTINALPEKCREVFKLSRAEGLKNREIAEKRNISIKAVEKHISVALTKLRIALKEYLPVLIFLILHGILY
ncbi:MAG: RNA polymerase sigma-70 factor [Bacteroidales bacterium]|nr:RNA polymerase sigma-70 factor [Bacteroidales bacterium]